MGLKQLKDKIATQKQGAVDAQPIQRQEPAKKRTPVVLKEHAAAKIEEIKAQVYREPEAELPKPTEDDAIPMGYTALGKHDVAKLMWLKDRIMQAKRVAFDYEMDGNPDDDATDPQDHTVVGVSVCYKKGMAVYLPIEHKPYAANWDNEWLYENFLKPILEHPDILVMAHNIKVEHQWSILNGVDMFPKTDNGKCMDTMLMVKALALPANTELTSEGWEVRVGLKPATKALLADENGMVHGLLHVDDIKDFGDTVGRVEWQETVPGEYYKTSTKTAKKGDPKTITKSRSRTFDELPVDQTTIDYACSDSDWTLGLYDKLYPLCVSEGIDEVLLELDVPFMMVLGEYELAGWHISREKLQAMEVVARLALDGDPQATTEDGRRGLESRLYEALIEITEGYADTDEEGQVIVPAGRWHMGKAAGGKLRGQDVYLEIKTAKPFSWGSNQHLPWLFFTVLGIDTRGLERSKATGLPGTGKDNMALIIEGFEGDNKFMKVLKEKKKYDKILSTYVEGMLPFCREDTSKLHTNMNLVSTWRLSSKKPNLQNIPRAENDPMGIRGVFVAPFYDPNANYDHLNRWTKPVNIITEKKLSGHTFYIGSDYAQIELKVLAWFAREAGMIKTLAEGGDLHSWVAHRVFKLACLVEEVKDKYKPFRYKAKKVNFGIVYGLTEYGLSKDREMGMTLKEAEKFIEDYMATFPGVKEYAKDMISFARKHGYVETMFKHRRPIPEINDPAQWIRKSGENKAMNTPIQGSASDIIRLAMVNIRREVPKSAPFVKGVMQIHDEIQAECPVEYAVQGARFVQEVMERPIEGFSEIMPIVSEPAVGATWDTALDLKFEADGTAYVKPKEKKKEATDVTYDMIAPYEHMYKLAGIKIA